MLLQFLLAKTVSMRAAPSRKRPRMLSATGPDGTICESVENLNADALRADLARRSSESALPAVFNKAAAFGGVAGTDAFLCHLGQSIASALRAVPESAEAARAQLHEMRGTLP